ncbi:MAG: hypothetical protein E7190_04370 [Erysipelotrichaceae bacterium]|nr:hypothetical protein [Erysipelotrichaceae bacterium]
MKDLLAGYIRQHWKPLMLMTVIWILLELPAVCGYQPVFFYPLYYLTGALSGITGGGILGMIFGAVARAIIYVFFEQMIIILFFSKLPMSERLASCKTVLKDKLTGIIPYFKTLKDLISNDYAVLSAEAAGFGTAMILSRLLSGPGLFRHSFVSLVLFIQITRELSSHSGLIFSLTKMLFRKLGRKEPEKDLLAKFLSTQALAFAVTPILPIRQYAYRIGLVFLVIAAVMKVLSDRKTKQ